MARRLKRRETEIFSISFLDCITCGLGSVVLLLVLSNLHVPLDQQAQCVRLAAEASVLVWRQHCERRGIEDLSPALLECFDRWRVGMHGQHGSEL